VSVITLQDYRQADKKTKSPVRCPPIEGEIYAMTFKSGRIGLKAWSKRLLLCRRTLLRNAKNVFWTVTAWKDEPAMAA
jgi:hypothetical protein